MGVGLCASALRSHYGLAPTNRDKPQKRCGLSHELDPATSHSLAPELDPGVNSPSTSTEAESPGAKCSPFPSGSGVRRWGMPNSRVRRCFPEALPWGGCPLASEPHPHTSASGPRDGKAGVGVPHCSPLISANEFLWGKEQTALQWDRPRPPQRGSLVSRAC